MNRQQEEVIAMAIMKCLTIFTTGVWLLFSSVPAMADQSEDEAAIRKVREQQDAAFSNHDAKGMAAHLDPSAESWDGSLKGAAQLTAFYADMFKRQPDIKSDLLEEIGIIFLTPDVAVYKARRDNTGLIDKDGKPRPQLKWLGAWVMVKKDNKWLVAAFFSRPIEE